MLLHPARVTSSYSGDNTATALVPGTEIRRMKWSPVRIISSRCCENLSNGVATVDLCMASAEDPCDIQAPDSEMGCGMPVRLVLCLLLTIGGLVWTEHHANVVHSMNRSDRQQVESLAASGADTGIVTDSNREKPSPAIKWQPGQRRPTRASKSTSTFADKQQLDKKTSLQ